MSPLVHFYLLLCIICFAPYYEKAPPEHRVNPANPNVDIVSFGLRIALHDAAQPIRWTTPRLFLAPSLKFSPPHRWSRLSRPARDT